MKKEFTDCPKAIDQSGLFGFASWQEYVAAVPAPLVAVTGYKSNGLANVTMQSWCALHGDHMLFAGVDKGSHLFRIVREAGELAVNFPTAAVFHRCMRTIEHNGWDEDEIAAAGLTAEPSRVVNAPRIAECPLSLECRCLWEREPEPGAPSVVLCLKVLHVAMDPGLDRCGPEGCLYNIRSRGDPETGERRPPMLGVLTELGTYGEIPVE